METKFNFHASKGQGEDRNDEWFGIGESVRFNFFPSISSGYSFHMCTVSTVLGKLFSLAG